MLVTHVIDPEYLYIVSEGGFFARADAFAPTSFHWLVSPTHLPGTILVKDRS